MNAVILTQEQYEEIIKRIDEIKKSLESKSQSSEDTFIDNADFIQAMKISKRTAQTWRDEGIISFSQVGSKIYYRMGDVQKMLESNLRPAFKRNRK